MISFIKEIIDNLTPNNENGNKSVAIAYLVIAVVFFFFFFNWIKSCSTQNKLDQQHEDLVAKNIEIKDLMYSNNAQFQKFEEYKRRKQEEIMKLKELSEINQKIARDTQATKTYISKKQSEELPDFYEFKPYNPDDDYNPKFAGEAEGLLKDTNLLINKKNNILKENE